ncbi:MAG: pilus assembly protein PilP [Magnetococcales bacterium]|nr:pilus assembly protein PilP [Magnetococcales bacterium]
MSNFYPYFLRYRLNILLCLAILLLPCSFAKAEANKAANEPTLEEKAPYIYEAQGKRDPFQIPMGIGMRPEEESTLLGVEKKPVRVPEYLEQFQLDSLKLVAILFHIEGQQSAAMVRDPEGKGHLIHVGQYIGVNEGQISQISDGEVTIIEPTPKLTNKARTITLRLHNKDGK